MLGSKWNVGSWSVRFFFVGNIYLRGDSRHFGRVVRSAVARESAGRFEKVRCSEEALVGA